MQLQYELGQENERKKSLEQSLSSAQSSIETNLKEIKELRVILRQLTLNNEKDRETSVKRAIEDYEQSIARLNEENSDLKRSVSKQGATIKALERQIAHEKEIAQREDNRKMDFYEMKLQSKESEIKQLRKERNDLWASLRQQERMSFFKKSADPKKDGSAGGGNSFEGAGEKAENPKPLQAAPTPIQAPPSAVKPSLSKSDNNLNTLKKLETLKNLTSSLLQED